MASYEKISELFDSNPYILRLLVSSDNLSEARRNILDYLNRCEEEVLDVNCSFHPLEKKNTRDCINVFKNIISKSNEKKTDHSCLNTLWKLATEHWRQKDWPDIADAFLVEMKHLFKGVISLSEIYSKSGICKREVPEFVNLEGRDSAVARSNLLNKKADQYSAFIEKNDYKTGLDSDVIKRRQENKKRILEFLGATEKDWADYRWHLKMPFQNAEKIGKVIELTEDEEACIKEATANRTLFGITPFYLSLIDRKQHTSKYDRSLRSQVIPNRVYLNKMRQRGINKKRALDFMNELDTSPVDLVTRRYPMISIIKPFHSCPQICIYCQRNWELLDKNCKFVASSPRKLDNAFAWFRNNPSVSEVLITGGDPLTMSNEKIDYLLQTFFDMLHIKRIRIGTRMLVTMPMRFNDDLIEIVQKYHNPPHKTITIVTHVQHSYEISSDMADVVRKIKSLGIDIYNQQVFTIQNCRKFETCFLRECLKGIGITPYYLFNLKGKDETSYFRVPIARLLQEQKEEARLISGLVRTDKAVFNIPTLGKNDLGSWQDHDIIMVLDDGSRVYEFYPWEKYMAPVNTFIYKDEPIYDFLKRLETLGENPEDYRTIWYYF